MELRRAKRNADEVGARLAMLEAIGQDPERECLSVGDGFIARCPIGEDSLEVGNLGDPATILFAIDFKGEMHAGLERVGSSRSNCACAASI